jgi:hypothetical protein
VDRFDLVLGIRNRSSQNRAGDAGHTIPGCAIRNCRDGEWPSLITHLRHELDVKEPVDLRFGGDLSPMTWGWRRPKILLPSTAHSWSPERRRVVLTHELAHVKRRDGVTQVLVQLACSLHWFNPLIWFAERRMRTERERACDDYVLNAVQPLRRMQIISSKSPQTRNPARYWQLFLWRNLHNSKSACARF